MNCIACRWWDPAIERMEYSQGQCRRRAPVLPLRITLGPTYGPETGRWPQTSSEDSCGEFERLVTTAENVGKR